MIRSSAAPIAARTLIVIDGNRREPTSTGANKRPTTEATPPRAASASRTGTPVLFPRDELNARMPRPRKRGRCKIEAKQQEAECAAEQRCDGAYGNRPQQT